MRMRKKKWALPELNACEWFAEDVDEYKGKWKEQFEKEQPLHIELGCGKGVSTAAMVSDQRNINFVAIDLISDVLGSARRNIAAAFGEDEVKNVIIGIKDCAKLTDTFSKEDNVKRIYISFPNPWDERLKHRKRRLTHPRQLEQYKTFLADDGEIWFKTDNDTLFFDSLEYFRSCGFTFRFVTFDLHSSGFAPNYLSEHEKMFTSQGIKTKFVIAKLK